MLGNYINIKVRDFSIFFRTENRIAFLDCNQKLCIGTDDLNLVMTSLKMP